jgi:Ca2+-binding RTX toxin-like protein
LIVELPDTNDVVLFEHANTAIARLTISGVVYDYPRASVRELAVAGGGGNDRLEAAADVDTRVRLSGGDGDDTLIGGADWDILDSGTGDDSLVGNDGTDEISFKLGDTLLSGNGSDSLSLFAEGTDGADTVQVTNLDAVTVRLVRNGVTYDYDRQELVAIAISGGLGDDVIELASDVEVPAVLLGGDGNDSLVGGAGADVLDSGLGLDTLHGAGGDDQLLFKPGGWRSSRPPRQT